MFFEIFDDSIRLETGVENYAVIVTDQVGYVRIFIERHGHDRANLKLGIWQNKRPFQEKAELSTIGTILGSVRARQSMSETDANLHYPPTRMRIVSFRPA